MQVDIHSQHKKREGHIVVLTGATFEGSGVNFYILNNAKQWKKLGYRVTVICQDRNAQTMPQVDSYIVGQMPPNTPKLEPGQMRVIIPHINNLIPIYATYQYCQFPGISSKPVQEMTQQQLETNITMTISCLRQVCTHDKPYKVIANYMILSGIIAARGLQGFNIPYDIIVPGPALMYSVKPYPHLWKWVLPGFKKANIIFQHTEFVKTQFLKCFKNQIQEYKLDVKVKAIPPGMDPDVVSIAEDYKQAQRLFIQKIKEKIKNQPQSPRDRNLNIQNNMKSQQIHEILTNQVVSKNNNIVEHNFVEKWLAYSEQDEIVLFVGALINNKGMGQLLAIAPKLISMRPTLKFIFCGSGPYKQHMKQFIKACEEGNFQRAVLIASAGQFITQINIEDCFIHLNKQISQRIIFAGLLQQQLIYKLLPLCTLYVVPSKMQQSTSMGVVQAICCGLTPICNDHSWLSQVLNVIQRAYPQLSQIIRVERSSFFDQLPNTIISVLDFIKNNKLSKQQYRQKLRKIVADNFSWRNTAEILAQERQFFEFP